MLSLAHLETRLRSLVNELIRSRATPAEIDAAVEGVLLEVGLAGPARPQAVDEMVDMASKQAAWLRGSISSPIERAGLASVLKFSANGFARIGGKIRQDILTLVSDSLEKDVSGREITNRLEYSLGQSRHVAETIVQTGTAAFDRIGRIADGVEAGAQTFRYAGPSADRRFCELLLAESKAGKSWTVEEIQRMDNGQGLSVLHHCGGYRCRHDWEPVLRSTTPPQRKPQSEDAAPRPILIERFKSLQKSMPLKPPPGRVQPIGNRTADFVSVKKGTSLDDPNLIRRIQTGMNAIGQVHGLGDRELPKLEISPILTGGMKGTYYASFAVRNGPAGPRITSYPPRIELSGGYMEQVVIHELGHALDDLMIGEARTWASRSSPLMQKWREAVLATEAVKQWEYHQKHPMKVYDRTGKEYEMSMSDRMTYLLDPVELWARSYAQYIIGRAGNDTLRRSMQRWDTGYSYRWQWDDDDFVPVAKAIDELFEELGWLERR